MDGGHIRVQAGLMKLVVSGHQRQNPAQAGQLQHLQNPWLTHSLSRVLNSPVKGDWRVQNQGPPAESGAGSEELSVGGAPGDSTLGFKKKGQV